MRPDPTAPRKTPRQARAAATVAAILEAAARILEARGLEGFNTNAVAERAGVSVGSLYQYFPGKDALLAALLRQAHADLAAALEAAVTVAGFRDAVRRMVAAAVAQELDRPRLARLLDLEEARLLRSDADRAMDARIVASVAGLLRRHALPLSDPLVAAADVIAIARGLIDAAGERCVPDRAALCARVEQAVLGYLLWSDESVEQRRAA